LVNGFAINLFTDKLENKLDKIIESGIFKESISNFFEFEFNNQYQKYFDQLIIIITNKHSLPKLVSHVFSECDLLNKIIDVCQNNMKFNFK
jgi:hypothetical protein